MTLRTLLYPFAAIAIAAFPLLTTGCATSSSGEDTTDAPAVESVEQPEADGETSAEDDSSNDEYVVEFRDRSIDLHPYVQGFPYSWFMPELEHGFMIYFETTPEGKWLRYLEFDEATGLDVTAGERLGDIDWSTRNFWGGEFNTALGEYVIVADEQNQEVFNVYGMDLETGAIEQMTDAEYLYGVGFSDDDWSMGYVVRHGSSEPFNSCLHVRDLESSEDTQLWCDEGGDDRLTWTDVEFAPDDQSVLVQMQHDGNRNKTNIARFDVDEPGEPELLLERGIEHMSLSAVDDTYDGEQFLYTSAKTGTNQIYRYDIASGESERLTDLEHEIRSIELLDDGHARPRLLVLQQLPYGTIVELRDHVSGEVVSSDQREESISIRDHHGGQAVLTMSSVDTPFRMERAQLHVEIEHPRQGEEVSAADSTHTSLRTEPMASTPDELADQLVQCDVERVEYPTFDEVDGSPRMLHAYLYEPKEQPAASRRLARITAFYGGSNRFGTTNQIMCEAGITTFSPSPRGSWGFGAEFEALNDGDLGGDDVIDIFYAARWLEENRDFEPFQIGVYGGSHGGYATMRALTFPPETNDRGESYDFGFGHSHAGISDLMHFYETSNIPDWLVLLAGDPETETDKLRERSPLTHVERLGAPLLLTHGSNDNRVPVDESRRFAEAARERDLPVVYEEFEGQGHGIDGLDNRMRYYRAIFEFLEAEVDPRLDRQADAQ